MPSASRQQTGLDAFLAASLAVFIDDPPSDCNRFGIPPKPSALPEGLARLLVQTADQSRTRRSRSRLHEAFANFEFLDPGRDQFK
jgi:hypothetical protein